MSQPCDARHGQRLIMGPIEHQKHDVEEEEIDSGLPLLAAAKRSHLDSVLPVLSPLRVATTFSISDFPPWTFLGRGIPVSTQKRGACGRSRFH